MAKIIRGWDGPFGDRYRFDFKVCSASKGWAQVDTRQDAPYYGTWCSPSLRQLVNYCEGDLTLTECDDDADFALEVRKCADWNKERDYWLGIDPAGADQVETFKSLGLGDLLHEIYRG